MQDGKLLFECLREGIGKQPTAAVRDALGLTEPAEDREIARALTEWLAKESLAQLAGEQGGAGAEERGSFVPQPVEFNDTSFLGRLKPRSQKRGDTAVDEVNDVTTLLAVLRAGSLAQRRAAARRIAEVFESVGGEERRAIEQVLEQLRDVEIAPELLECRLKISGIPGREAQLTLREVRQLSADIAPKITAYWDGELLVEPLMALSGDQRAQLLVHARHLDDLVIAHVAALIEGATGSPDRRVQRAMLSAVRYAGDPRLLPALVSLLEVGDGELGMEASRAISRIEDPRTWKALLAAYERSVVDRERISLGGALGRVGDVRAADYVREQLRSQDEHVLIRAIEAMRTLGSADDSDAVAAFVASKDAVIATKAAHTLARIGDARALPELTRLAREAPAGAVRASIEEAIEHIRARLVLRGEEPPSESLLVVLDEQQRAEGTALLRAPFGVRLRAYRHFLAGRLWQLFGATQRALVRFDLAASCRPGWAVPLVAAGMLQAGREEYAQALGLFRRAIDAERERVERNPLIMRVLARCFLRRSEQVERDGRVAIARGLLDEVMSLDLRHAPSSLRFEIGRRHEALRVLGAG
jgi:tetratricopeptide (TPR) repeat protein